LIIFLFKKKTIIQFTQMKKWRDDVREYLEIRAKLRKLYDNECSLRDKEMQELEQKDPNAWANASIADEDVPRPQYPPPPVYYYSEPLETGRTYHQNGSVPSILEPVSTSDCMPTLECRDPVTGIFVEYSENSRPTRVPSSTIGSFRRCTYRISSGLKSKPQETDCLATGTYVQQLRPIPEWSYKELRDRYKKNQHGTSGEELVEQVDTSGDEPVEQVVCEQWYEGGYFLWVKFDNTSELTSFWHLDQAIYDTKIYSYYLEDGRVTVEQYERYLAEMRRRKETW
jgi:hypothetical protein